MPGNIPQKLGTANQPITLTVTSLANGATRGSTAIDNSGSTTSAPDAFVSGKIKTNASGTLANGTVVVYAYGSADGGTTYQEGFAGTDGAVTLTSPPNVRRIAVINAVSNATTYYMPPTLVAQAFGGRLPDHWGIFVTNNTGATLDASVGGFWYETVMDQYT